MAETNFCTKTFNEGEFRTSKGVLRWIFWRSQDLCVMEQSGTHDGTHGASQGLNKHGGAQGGHLRSGYSDQ